MFFFLFFGFGGGGGVFSYSFIYLFFLGGGLRFLLVAAGGGVKETPERLKMFFGSFFSVVCFFHTIKEKPKVEVAEGQVLRCFEGAF